MTVHTVKKLKVAGLSKQNTSAIFIIPGIIKHGTLFVFALSMYVVHNLYFSYSDIYKQFQTKKFQVS
jgi:hypothetical protein